MCGINDEFGTRASFFSTFTAIRVSGTTFTKADVPDGIEPGYENHEEVLHTPHIYDLWEIEVPLQTTIAIKEAPFCAIILFVSAIHFLND